MLPTYTLATSGQCSMLCSMISMNNLKSQAHVDDDLARRFIRDPLNAAVKDTHRKKRYLSSSLDWVSECDPVSEGNYWKKLAHTLMGSVTHRFLLYELSCQDVRRYRERVDWWTSTSLFLDIKPAAVLLGFFPSYISQNSFKHLASDKPSHMIPNQCPLKRWTHLFPPYTPITRRSPYLTQKCIA